MLEAILNNRYDTNILAAPPIAIIWAAEWIKDLAKAKAELKAANAKREKAGIIPAYPEYGSRLF